MADGESLSNFTVKMTPQKLNLNCALPSLKEKGTYGDRTNEKKLVNDGLSLRLMDKTITAAASPTTTYKITKGKSISQSLEERHTSNRIKFNCYEMMVNGHKFNSNLWDYTDFKKYTDPYGDIHTVGRFAVDGTILTPTWDTLLNKYVLIRRRMRTPMFSPKNNVPQILKTLDITDPTEVAYNYGTKMKTQEATAYYTEKGYQFDDKTYATETSGSSSSGSGSCSADVERVIEIALDLGSRGIPYVSGGHSESGFDCTGFVSYCFNKAGFDIEISHASGFDLTFKNCPGFQTLAFSEDIMQRGDVLSSPDHTELYLGNMRMVGAHSTGTVASEVDYNNATGWTEIFRPPAGTSPSPSSTSTTDKDSKK